MDNNGLTPINEYLEEIKTSDPEFYAEIDKEYQNKVKKIKHGGSRKDAGRKKIAVKRVKTTFELLEEDKNTLKDLSLSLGISQNTIIAKLIHQLKNNKISIL